MIKLQLYFVLFILIASCTDIDHNNIKDSERSKQFQLNTHTESDAKLTDVNCYLFRDGIFYKKYANLDLSGTGRIEFDIPAHSELFFLANITEPSQLATMQKGVTTSDEFFSFHTPAEEEHSATRAPSKFYSAKVSPDVMSSSPFIVTLESSLSRIDLDATDAGGSIKIERIYTRSTSKTTSYFSPEGLSHKIDSCSYSHTFDTPETGKVEDLFRIYESDAPVIFVMEGTYGDKPISISTPIKKVKRNKIYKIRIQSAGMNVQTSIQTEDWMTGKETPTIEGEGTDIRIDADHSVFPAGITMDASRTTVDIPYTGTTELELSFLTDGELKVIGIEGWADLSSAMVSRPEGKYLTRYRIEVSRNPSQLASCATLNLKSTSGGQNAYGKITLNTQPYPYRIREITIGGRTWMAFNVGASESVFDQVYPEFFKYTEIEELYKKDWKNSLGQLHQWTSNPCPEGYRLPTVVELRDLLSGDPNTIYGGGLIPGRWWCNGEFINSRILTSSPEMVNIDGVSATTRYLELKNDAGAVIYFPLGGTKSTATENPDYGISLNLWSSNTVGTNEASSYKLVYGNYDRPGEVVYSIAEELRLNKEAYASVRCLKSDY